MVFWSVLSEYRLFACTKPYRCAANTAAVMLACLGSHAALALGAEGLSAEGSSADGSASAEPVERAVSSAPTIKRPFKIRINGIDGELAENAMAWLDSIRPKGAEPSIDRATAERAKRRSVEAVQTALQAFGYYEAAIDVRLLEESAWVLSVAISAGKQTQYRSVEVALQGSGREQMELLTYLAANTPTPGDPVLHGKYESFKSTLQQRAYDLGYIEATFSEHRIDVQAKNAKADLKLILQTGERFYFAGVDVQQNAIRPELIERLVLIKDGDPFESARLIDMQLRLSQTGFFKQVGVEVHHERASNYRIPVTVSTERHKSSRYTLSGGYGTDTGVRAGLGADFRRINSRGHRASTRLQVSELQTNLAAQYVIPIGALNSEFLDFSAELQQENINALDTREYSLTSSLNQNRWGGRRRVSLYYGHEKWQFGALPSESASLLIPGLEFTYKNADDPLNTRRGYSVTMSVKGAVENVLSDSSFVQTELYARAVIPTSERSRLLLRADLGVISTDDFERLPPSLRFFAGGAQSVRGYGYKDLSPRNMNGDRTGGRYLSAFSVEWDYLIKGNLGAALFFDAGDATRQPIERLQKGVGIGFRYRAPVGSLRLDLAHPLDDPDDSFRLHISFGVDL